MGRRYIPPDVINNICLDVASQIVANQINYNEIAKRYKVDHDTIKRIHNRNSDKIQTYTNDRKKLESAQSESLLQMVVNRLKGEFGNISTQSLLTGYGIITDKSRLYRGEPTIIEHTSSLEVGDVLKLDPKEINSPPPLPQQLKVI